MYAVTAQIDGQTLYSGTPNNNGGQCSPVGESGGALMFDASQPCPASESVDLPINTTGLADGQHTLKLTVEDAAANTSVVYDGTITTTTHPRTPPRQPSPHPPSPPSAARSPRTPANGPRPAAPAPSPTPTNGKTAIPKAKAARRSPAHKTPPTPPRPATPDTPCASP